jgi:hypothetical protein
VTALEGLSTIGVGDVAVTATGNGWVIEFQGALAGINVPTISVNPASLTGGHDIDVDITREGSTGTNEVQTISFESADESDQCQIGLVINGQSVGSNPIGRYFSAAQVKVELDAMVFGYGGSMHVTKSGTFPDPEIFTVEFQGGLAATDMNQMTAEVTVGTAPTIATVTNGSTSAVNEIQQVTLRTAPTAGDFTLTFGGDTTSALAFNAAHTDVATALEALASIGAANVSVTRSGSGTLAAPYYFVIEFVTALGGMDVEVLVADATGLDGGRMSVVQIQTPTAGVNEKQRVTVATGVTGGTFTLTYSGQTTGTIAYNASAATVSAALIALSNIDAGEVAVTGVPGGPWDVTFQNDLGSIDQVLMTGDGTLLTGATAQAIAKTEIVTSTGKHYWDNAANWDTGAVPVTGDTVWIENSDVSILYGLAQSAVTLAALNIDLSFAGTIGLPDYTDTGYYEYRAKELAIGATLQNWGSGIGGGSILIRINNGSVATTGVQIDSGRSNDETVAANQWRGTHASNNWTVLRGEFGAAIYGGQAATLASFEMGSPDAEDPTSDLLCEIGDGVTLTTLTVQGGVLSLYCTVGGNFRGTAGIVNVYRAAAITGTSTIAGCRLNWLSSGEMTGAVDVSAGGFLDFSQDPRGRTVAGQLTAHAGSTLNDRHRTVTWTSPPRLHKCGLSDVNWDLGRGLQLTITNI